MNELRLGLNIDHVATVRNARGSVHPDPVRAALIGQEAGADGITAHLREDRRHIRDDDILILKKNIHIPLNFEMAATEEMLGIALDAHPNACCVVPERREELTTEGGLNIPDHIDRYAMFAERLKQEDIRVSFFIEPEEAHVRAAADIGADIVEFHTGYFCHVYERHPQDDLVVRELKRIQQCAKLADSLGLEAHAGHGLTFDTVPFIAEIPEIRELNIGHFLIGEAIFTGLAESVKKMRALMDQARNT